MVTVETNLGRHHSGRLRNGSIVLLSCLAGGVLFGLLAFASVELTRADSRIAAVWIPNALAVAALLRYRVASAHLFILTLWAGNTAANFVGGDDLANAAELAACNAMEILLAVWLTRRWCGESPDMQDFRQLARFLGGAAIIAPMASATLASISLAPTGGAAVAIWFKWAATDGLGMAIIAPSTMLLIDALRQPRKPSLPRLTEWFAVVSGGALVTIGLFYQNGYPFLFLTGPVMLLHAFRLGATGTTVGMAVTAAISIVFTSIGHGPVNLVDADLTTKLVVLQLYLASAFLMGLPIAAMLAGRERAILDLARKQRELSLLADNITDAVIAYDTAGRCTYASRSVETVMGDKAPNFIGKQSGERAHPESLAKMIEVEQRLLNGQCENERFTFRRLRDDKNGRPVYIEADCAVARRTPESPPSGIVVSARNVTDRVELEMELTRAHRIAQQAAQGKTEFLANMSHEIRTPMNGVLGFAELLAKADLPAEQHHYAELIVQSGRSMMMLLNDILDLAKIEAGHITIEHEAIDLSELMHDCVNLHQASAQKKGLELSFDGPERGPVVVTDGLRLRQILINLLSNAVKFTEMGAITLRLSVRDSRVMIQVEDTGIGIPEDRLAHVFEPFEQGETNTTRRFGGTGLGLTISRQLAQLLGGYLDVVSEEGVGSRFTISIPHEAASNLPLPQSTPVARPEPAARLQPARILLAEDHDINRMLVTAMLERCGQNVTIARDGEEAIEAVLESFSQGRQFDLVLMDIQMPNCDGYTATRAIRGQGIRSSQLPIIALTANAYPEDIAAAREAGMQAHLAKPLAFADLVQALQRWLPVRIVDEYEAPAEKSGNASLPSAVHSPSLLKRWQVRRKETLDAVSEALRNEAMTGEDAEALAKLVHTLAGTAGMFGEVALGECASSLERALKSEAQIEDRRALAQELLDIASEPEGPKRAAME